MKTSQALQYGTISAMDALRHAVIALQQAHIETASLDARLLLQHVMGLSREALLDHGNAAMTPDQAEDYRLLIDKRRRRQPVAQLIERREFWGKEYRVTPATLDPRPDSETLVASVLERCAGRNTPITILDFGTGSGCLLLSLLGELPAARGVGVDVSPQALDVARENALRHNLAHRAEFVRSSWGEKVEGSFDVIISNPPYIPTAAIAALADEVRIYEPRGALDGGQDGLDCYRELLPQIANLLAPEGLAALEIGAGQQAQVAVLAQAAGLTVTAAKKDLAGIVRCLLMERETQTLNAQGSQ